MRVLVDIVHPAHVHFFRHILAGLQRRGHQTLVVARDKEVTHALLEAYGLPYQTLGRPAGRSRPAQFAELVQRVRFLAGTARRFDADVILTRNPAGVQAAWVLGVPSIFDTDDGRAAGVLFKAAAPFATRIATPDCLAEDYGPRHLKYPGYKQSAYLHPDLFTPDPSVLSELGLTPGEPFFMVRFVSMQAAHDHGESGMLEELKSRIIETLESHGPVLISVEGALPPVWRSRALSVPAHRMHDLLAHASLFVGDSQTMAAEAAMLGVPNLRMSSFVGRLAYLDELEHRYGLTFGFKPHDWAALLSKLEALLADADRVGRMRARCDRMLSEKPSPVDWFIRLSERLGSRKGV